MAEVDRRAHELEVALLAVGAEAGDERAVELELADREAAQVGERREAGAEVVDRDDDAERRAASSMTALGALEVGDDAGLGDLEDQRLGGQVVLLEQVDARGR